MSDVTEALFLFNEKADKLERGRFIDHISSQRTGINFSASANGRYR